ncbi:kazal-type serine protease inhibitor domain-containing protein 1-like [Corythoichthys intestinalis]|uniref:kazal-type serine protease inhibitor domain-containing protein 1-like n=1 Tax=Corythoichthys intestinalis TaxID=161448 RepID=UPI0025A5F9EE|nr:kazal-type serine protease inhibitor domain-containing protein 1-like [Corythoichthys intestinalis]XP_061803849.1 kazal-type serine protease inhibitor domain-containing protein 1-like [Nerophis lumbriciformis]
MSLAVALLLLVLWPNPRPCRPLEEEGDQQRPTGAWPEPDCGPCRLELCPAGPLGCRAGVVSDRCGCCPECANLEGQACDPGGQNVLFGLCGDGMRCQAEPRRHQHHYHPEDEEEDEEEQVCVCQRREAVCGSDGVTYSNMCHLREAAYSDPKLHKKGKGPCKTVPIIKVAPRSQVNGSGSHLVFLCEVFAFPMAAVEWRKDGADDEAGEERVRDGVLPGDDPHISVQSRGGPLRFELSSWLQIEGAEPRDSGTYRCVARNSLGAVSASAVLGVLSPEELSSYSADRASVANEPGHDRDSV